MAGQKEEVLTTSEKIVACNGGPLSVSSTSVQFAGHPLIYLKIGDKKQIECPYCSRIFIYQAEF